MVSSEAPMPATKRMQPGRRAECVVHQLIEEQRKSKERSAGNSPNRNQYHAHPIYSQSHRHDDPVDISNEKNMDKIVDLKCPVEKQKCRAVLDPDCLDEDNEIGQVDQKAWTEEMTKSDSETDSHQQKNDPVHSRMLTKKQLSDMAWGVRELSRRLSSMRIRFRVRTIFLLTKIHDSDLIVNTRALAQWLLSKERDVKYVIYVEKQFKTNKRFDAAGLVDEVAHEYAKDGSVTEDAAREGVQRRLRYWDEAMCRSRPHSFDFVITLGGDGTVLYASWLFQRIVPPVLSFALGSLGFLTKFDFEDYKPILNSAFSKGVTVSLRLRFECTVMRSVRKRLSESESDEDNDETHYRRDLVEELIGEENEDEHTHKPEGTFEILNELVVDRGPNPSEFLFLSCSYLPYNSVSFATVMGNCIC
jgi:NAD+ kinase